jgi:hypothetical protein
MTFGVTARARVGFSIALLATIAIGGTAAFTRVPFLRHNLDLFAIGACIVGVLGWMKGGFSQVKAPEAIHISEPKPSWEAEPAAPGAPGEHPLDFLASLRYWGIMLMVVTATVYFFSVRHVEPPKPIPKRIVFSPPPKAPVAFPPLKLQGLVVSGDMSSALINGQVLRPGDGIGNVRLVAIWPDRVEVELDGQTNVLSLAP